MSFVKRLENDPFIDKKYLESFLKSVQKELQQGKSFTVKDLYKRYINDPNRLKAKGTDKTKSSVNVTLIPTGGKYKY